MFTKLSVKASALPFFFVSFSFRSRALTTLIFTREGMAQACFHCGGQGWRSE
jgi:hypothetical protein